MINQKISKLRVLCLHGFGTNAQFFRFQMKQFIKMFESEINFVFIDAPFVISPDFVLDDKILQKIKGETRTWGYGVKYHYEQIQFFKRFFALIQPLFKDQSFDGIIAFSQGTMIAHILLKLSIQGTVEWQWLKKLKFCIFASGNHWVFQKLGVSYKSQINIPSIHFVSTTDFLYQKSLLGTTQFRDSLVIHHSFGHSIPKLGREQYLQVKRFLQNVKKNESQHHPVKSKL